MGFERHQQGGSTVGSSARSGGNGVRTSAAGVGKRTLVQDHEAAPVQRKGPGLEGRDSKGEPERRESEGRETEGHESGGRETEGRETEGRETEINATIVPGSQFTGRGRSTPEPEQILSRASSDMTSVVAAELRGSILSLRKIESIPRFEITLVPQGNKPPAVFLVRISAEPLRYSEVARSQVNTDQRKHTVQLSHRIADAEIARALIHELTEIIAETRSAEAGAVPAHDDALQPGPVLEGARLSFHDQGRLAELRFLAHQLDRATPEDQAHLRSEITALIEHLGLRAGMPGVRERGELVAPLLDDETRHVLRELTLPVASLPQADRKALAAVTETARTRDEGPLAAEQERRMPLRTPLPRQDGRIDREAARKLAEEARAARTRKSRETYVWLMRTCGDALQRGQPPIVTCPVQIGAGGATSGLTPDTLFIDASGRWQRDAADDLAQTAGQVSAVRRTGLGDPFEFASANERVPLAAVRYWQDTAAAKARVLDATAELSLQHDVTVLHIKPLDSAPPLRVVIQGTPTIATGFPVERVPGTAMSPAGAVATIRAGLEKLGSQAAFEVHAAIRGLGGNDDAEVIAVARALVGHDDVRDTLRGRGGELPAALDTVMRYADWGAKRARTPGRVVRGDEANLDTFDPMASDSWLVAGTGGTAISAAENILKKNERATVHMVGRNAPPGLDTNTQWQSIVTRYKERFSYEFRPEGIGPVQSEQAADAHNDRYTLGDKTAGGYIAALGRNGALPAPIARMAQQHMHRDPASVYGSLLWGADEGQYLGYRITVSDHDFDVTGAASRFLPPELFTSEEFENANAERDATDESGGFGGGFNATVHQTHDLAQHRRTGSIRVVRSRKIPMPPDTGTQARL